MFQWRFEMPILASVKTSTIRRSARCKPGDVLSLRSWIDKPYRSKQRVVKTAVCKSVTPLRLGLDDHGDMIVFQDDHCLSRSEMEQLAKVEGFDDIEAMRQWFESNHKLKPGEEIDCEQIQW